MSNVDNLYEYLMMAYFILIPFDFYLSGFFNRALTTHLSIIIIALFILDVLIRNKNLYFNSSYIYLFVYLTYILFNSLLNDYYNLSQLSFLFYYFVLSLVFVNIIKENRINLKRIYFAYLFGIAMVIILLHNNFELYNGRLRYTDLAGNYFNPNSLSVYAFIGLIFIFYIYNKSNYKRKLNKLFYLLISFILTTILILTFSRTTIFSVIFSVLISLTIFYFNKFGIFFKKGIIKLNKNNIKLLFFLSLFLVIFIIINYSLDFKLPLERFNIMNKNLNRLTAGRLTIWKNGFDLMKDNYLLGIGFGNYSNMYGHFFKIGRSSHSIFIKSLIETGIIGLVILSIFLINNFLEIIKYYKIKNYEFFIGLIISLYLIISGFGNDTMYYKYFWILFIVFQFTIVELRKKVK